MTIGKKEFYSLVLILALILLLPVTLYFLKGRFDIRPRAQLAGAANFILTPDTTGIFPGQRVNVLAAVELTDSNIRTTGVDFTLLYDSNLLKVVSLAPVLGNNFTESVLVDDQGLPYLGEGSSYSYVRLALVARKNKADLQQGTVALANITFEAIQSGQATIKLPEDNAVLQVVGTTL